MIHKLKNYLKLGTLLFCVSIFINSCQKDDDFQQEEPVVNYQAKYNTSIVYSKTINSNENLKQALNKLRGTKEKNKPNQTSKLILNDSLNIAIEDTSAKYLETPDGSYHSYTFVAFDYDHPQGIQNVLLSLQPDGSYRELLIRYDLTANEIELFRNNEYVNLDGKVSFAELDGNSFAGDLFSKETAGSGCLVWDPSGGSNCTDVDGHTWEDGNACPHYLTTIQTATPTVYNVVGIDWDCVGIPSGGSQPTTGNTPSGQQSGAGGILNTTQDASAGYPPTAKQQREQNFIKVLANNDNDECFNGLPEEQQTQIFSFLEAGISIDLNGETLFLTQTTYNQSDIDFAEQAALAICDDSDLEFEDLEKFINGMDKRCQALAVFRSISKIDSPFTNKIKNYFLLTNTNNLNLQDLATGESVADEPEMPANVGARVLYEPAADGTIILQFNNTHLDTATTLGFINTFYHELVHAYILRLYYSGELLNEYPTYTDLKIAIDNFLNDDANIVLGDIFDKEMHDIYVDFIDEIAESIVAYCNFNNIDGVNLVYAKKLVWGGLNGYDVFSDNLTPAQQNEAQTLLAYENSNITANAKGTKTCN